MAGVYSATFAWEPSEREFRRALEVNPNVGDVHHWYAYMLASMGRCQEAIAEAKQAVEIEPLNLKYLDSLGQMYDFAGQYDQAVERFKKNLEMDPNYQSSVHKLAFTYRDMHQYELWLAGWKRGATLANDREDMAIAEEAARVYSKSGYRATTRADRRPTKNGRTGHQEPTGSLPATAAKV